VCSAKEQEADKAERTAVQWKTALFLRDRVGEVFSGRVSGVVAFGFFIELEEVFADALVHIKELLDDYYQFDEKRHRLVGERTGKVWRLGDRVKVRLVRVDLDSFQIEAVPFGIKPDRRAARTDDRRPKKPQTKRRGRAPRKGR
jgi:ribonuclease R